MATAKKTTTTTKAKAPKAETATKAPKATKAKGKKAAASEAKPKVNTATMALRGKDVEALKQELTESQKQVYALRSQSVTQKVENPHQYMATRHQVARIKTVLREMQINKKE
jgi:large subunit ribosomal protein L29